MTTAAAAPAAETGVRFEQLHITEIVPSKTNPRTHFDDTYLAELAGSIREKGLIQPIIVRVREQRPHHYEIVAGECRYRASKLAGLQVVPAIVRQYTDAQVLETQLEENIHRKDLTPLEEAVGYRRLIDSNPTKHSAETIATRIGMSVAYVWDRLKLHDLIPEAKQLLETEKITVGHAILLSRLKASDQQRTIAFDDDSSTQYRGVGLWRPDSGFDFDEDGPANKGRTPGKYDALKPCSVRELEAWIQRHIRFDVEHAAKAEPLVFEQTALDVQHAAALPGRGRKVISITDEYRVADDARAESERTYDSQSWERADGHEKSKTCDHSVLGVFVAGPGYGSTRQVCVARDKCRVHFGQVIAAREKNQKLREAGKGKQAARNESKAEDKYRREREERERAAAAWDKLQPEIIADAVAQVKGAKKLPAAAARILDEVDLWNVNATLTKHLGKTWFQSPGAHTWLVLLAGDETADSFDDYVRQTAKPLGLDLKRLEAIRAKHAAADPAKPAPAKAKGKKR